MQHLKLNLTNTDISPVIMPMATMAFAEPLYQHFGIPVLVTNVAAGLFLLVWFAFYGLRVWRRASRDKKAFEKKVTVAEEQLFIGK